MTETLAVGSIIIQYPAHLFYVLLGLVVDSRLMWNVYCCHGKNVSVVKDDLWRVRRWTPWQEGDCCAGCNDHCMQNVKGWKDNEGVQCLMSFPGGYIPSGTPRNTAHVPDSGLAPLRRSTSVSSFQSSLSSASVAEDINKPRPPPVPPNNVNVSFNGEARKSSRQMLGASIADNRRRIAALLGKLSP